MSWVNDVGGQFGLGPILTEPNEPPFHEAWEGRVHGLSMTCRMNACYNTPEQRHTVESMPHGMYILSSHYEKWLYACETVLLRKGVITKDELDTRIAMMRGQKISPHAQMPVEQDAHTAKVLRIIYQGTPQNRPLDRKPRFRPGNQILTRTVNPEAHCRLPGYAKGKKGIITAYHGAHCHPAIQASGGGEVPEHLYTVQFSNIELWGNDTEDPNGTVSVDLFEDYLAAIDERGA